jgi:hypothetical protein
MAKSVMKDNESSFGNSEISHSPMDGRFACVEVHEWIITKTYFRKFHSLPHRARLGNKRFKVLLPIFFYDCK